MHFKGVYWDWWWSLHQLMMCCLADIFIHFHPALKNLAELFQTLWKQCFPYSSWLIFPNSKYNTCAFHQIPEEASESVSSSVTVYCRVPFSSCTTSGSHFTSHPLWASVLNIANIANTHTHTQPLCKLFWQRWAWTGVHHRCPVLFPLPGGHAGTGDCWLAVMTNLWWSMMQMSVFLFTFWILLCGIL